MKLFYFVFLFFFAQKTYIQCGKLIDGISNTPVEHVSIIKGNIITDIQPLENIQTMKIYPL